MTLHQLIRGVYPAGDMEVTSRRWWSPKDRKSAKLAARVLIYQQSQPEYEAAKQRAAKQVANAMIYGYRQK